MFVDYRDTGILVLEDDVFTLKVTTHILNRVGFAAVFKATSVSAAVELLSQSVSNISFILADLNLPGEDALDLFEFLERTGYAGGVILYSGMGTQAIAVAEIIAKSRNLNIIGTLQKPLDANLLTDMLTACCKDSPTAINASKIQALITREELTNAIDNDQIVPWFQPKVDTRTLKLCGFEALARWQHETHGLVPPPIFIPLAEEFGLINLLTLSMARQCSETLICWQKQGFTTDIAINISMRSLDQVDFAQALVDTIDEYQIPAGSLHIEITESQLMNDPLKPLEALLRLQMKRFTLLIDDFGTGHSSLEQLRTLPFDGLKIDKSFVHSSRTSDRAMVILKSSIQIARDLGMYTIAEGVETMADWQRVVDLGFDQVQGHLIAKPMPGEKIPAWLKHWKVVKSSLSTRI